MKQQSDFVRDLTEPGWREREKERDAEFKRWCEAMHQKTSEQRIAALEAELVKVKADEAAIRELMNVYNLGGWTDALEPMKRALKAEAERDAVIAVKGGK
jgi:hypothetical protein